MSWLTGVKHQVWYCSKFDEIHVIHLLAWNKYIAAMEMTNGDCVAITWPRSKLKNNWHYIGEL